MACVNGLLTFQPPIKFADFFYLTRVSLSCPPVKETKTLRMRLPSFDVSELAQNCCKCFLLAEISFCASQCYYSFVWGQKRIFRIENETWYQVNSLAQAWCLPTPTLTAMTSPRYLKLKNAAWSTHRVEFILSGSSYEFSKLLFVKYILITLDLDQALCFIILA